MIDSDSFLKRVLFKIGISAIAILPGIFLSACSSQPAVRPEPVQSEIGLAGYYARKFHGRLTANGERYDENTLTAAHRRLPFGTVVRVTNLKNKRTVEVRINDRGPYIKGRIIDLSFCAARQLGMLKDGIVQVAVTSLP